MEYNLVWYELIEESMSKADNQVEDSTVSEQEQPQDLRKFIDKVMGEDGEEVTVEHMVKDFTDEQKNVFNKLEIIVQAAQKQETQYQFTKEQHDVLSNHYVSELKTLLSSGEDEGPEVVSDGEEREKS